jgi:hypothetical protein
LIKNAVFFGFLLSILFTMQHSGAQNIVPISKEGTLTPDEEPDVQGQGPAQSEEPQVKGEEPQVKGEEPKPQKEEPSGVDADKDKPEVKGEQGSEEQSTPTTPPGKGTVGGLDIANQTQQTLPPAYKIKIIFDAIKRPTYYNSQGQIVQAPCENWDMGVYVQGKLVRLNNINQPLKLCADRVEQFKDKEATVEIPGEQVESVKDYQPLSIFSAGSKLDNCNPKPLPVDLPEVKKVLQDKGSTRPYYAHAREGINKIQDQMKNGSNGCIEKYWYNPYYCFTWNGQTGCAHGYHNESLTDLNYLFASPGYGKFVPENTVGNPETAQINTCTHIARQNYQYTSQFCLSYTIQCPLCPAVRVH